jgi:murein DD-endopeptidase MepM/ murein hydrolase activator NlpD
MIKIVKKTVVLLQILVLTAVLAIGINQYIKSQDNIARLKSTNIELTAKISEDTTKYEATIKEIVEKLKITDAYLFVGGMSVEESNAFSLRKNELLLTSATNNLPNFLTNTDLLFTERQNSFNDFPTIVPFLFVDNLRVSSYFGSRFSPITKTFQPHHGIDITPSDYVPNSEDIYIIATADGYIQDHWLNHKEYGEWVIIRHKNNIETHYAHMDECYVHEGDFVKKGDKIGTMGNSGQSTGRHLHYGVAINGAFVNPLDFLTSAYNFEEYNLTKKE